MTREQIIANVAAYYTGKLSQHGASALGVDWNGPESQAVRFAQLARVIDREPFSLIDYGSGYGALATYLGEHFERIRYTGFDVSAAMVAQGRELFDSRPEISFTSSEQELESADFTVASGVFNVKLDTPDPDWHDYAVDTVRRMLALSRRGIAFNMLTGYSDKDKRRSDLHYADPLAWFDWCKRNASRQVALLHDYGLWEFTIVVRLEQEA